MRNRLLWVFAILFIAGLGLYFAGFRMTKADLHISAAAEPLFCIGGQRVGEFCDKGTIFPFTNSLLMTLLIDLALILTVVFGIRNMKLIPTGLQNIVELLVEGFYNFAVGIDRKNVAKFFPLPATILIFFLYANMFALVPGVGSIGICAPKGHAEAAGHSTEAAPAKPEAAKVEEKSVYSGLPGACGKDGFVIPYLRAPAADLNVTLAFSLAAVFMVEYFGFQALGFSYMSKFFNFREGAIGVFVGLIELLSEFIRIIAFAFRIFGNIFGGEVILIVMSFLFPYLLPLPFYGFEVFVAAIQAVIFAVLTLVFMNLAVQSHGGHDEHGNEAHVPVEAGDLPGHTSH